MGYTKLFSEILDSTVWREPHPTRLMWITMLAMADKNGEIMASVPGLADRARVSMEDCQTALACFLAPDAWSRSKDYDGRRIEEIDGGWRLVNFEKFRFKMGKEERRERVAERVRRHREKIALQSVTDVTSNECNTTRPDHNQTKPEVMTDKLTPGRKPKIMRQYTPEFDAFWQGVKSNRPKGLKGEAFDAWLKAGSPDCNEMSYKWQRYRASNRDTFCKDVCRWIKNDGHLQTYGETA